MKKTFVSLVICTLLIATFTSVAEPIQPTTSKGNIIRIDNATASPGETISVPIYGTWIQGIIYTEIELIYDSAQLTITDVTLDGCIGEGTYEEFYWDATYSLYVYIGYDDYTAIAPGTGKLFNIIITIKPLATPGNTPLTFGISGTNYYDDWNSYSPECINGHIEILNTPPSIPSQPNGPTIINQFQEKYFTTSSVDPENQMIRYRFDWDAEGTHDYSSWSTYVPSGQLIGFYHSWNSPGTYQIKAQAEDYTGGQTEWSTALTVTVDQATDWWPMFMHDRMHTGASSSSALLTNSMYWKFATGNTIATSPAVVDGKVFFGSLNRVYCFAMNGNNDGTTDIIWSYLTSGVVSSPAVVDGKVYICSQDKKLYCLDAQGNGDETTNLLWSFQVSHSIYSSPVVYAGKVYFGCNNKMYCLNSDTGEKIWEYQIGSTMSTTAVVYDSKIYFSSDTTVYCCDAAGNGAGTTTKIWSYVLPSTPYSFTISNNQLYIGASDHNVYCLDATGNGNGITNKIWEFTTNGNVLGTPAVLGDRLFVGSYIQNTNNQKMYCLDACGNGDGTTTKIWEYPIGAGTIASAAIADGFIYIPLRNCSLYCLDAQGAGDGTTTLIWSYLLDQFYTTSSPAIVDGKLFIGAGSYLCCFKNNLPPTTPQQPQGPDQAVIGKSVVFTTLATDPDNDFLQYGLDCNNDDIIDMWNTTFIASGSPGQITYTFWQTGDFSIRMKARDQSMQSGFSEPLSIQIINHAPDAPIIQGPEDGTPGEKYKFTIQASDPDDHDICYEIDWNNDGTADKITEVLPSDTLVNISYQWNESGIYTFQVRAKDTWDAGSWANHQITIQTPVNLSIGEITVGKKFKKSGFLQINAEIKNTGETPATNVEWEITVNGSLVFKGDKQSGVLDSLDGQATQIVINRPVLGFGKITITVTVRADSVPETTKTIDGFLFLFFIKIQ